MSVARYEMSRTRTIVAGAGSRDSLVADIDRDFGGRVGLVSSPSVAAMKPYADLREALGARVVLEFPAIKPHPPAEEILDLISRAKAAEVEVFVSVGGGSTVDAAKYASLAAHEEIGTVDELIDFGVHFEYPDREWTRPLAGRPTPVLAIPTTLSAAEWDGFAGTVDARTGIKHVARYIELTPAIVYLDPELAARTPRPLWATTGIRALDHAIETSYAINAVPYTTALAVGALELLVGNLRESVADPEDYNAALACQWAGMMSITGVHNVSLGLSHAIGHQLGGYGVPHGVTSCITLPHVMRFLLPETVPQQTRIAQAFGRSAAEEAASAVEEFFAELDVPRRLRDTGLPREVFGAIADATLGDIVARESPVPLSRAAIVELLESAW